MFKIFDGAFRCLVFGTKLQYHIALSYDTRPCISTQIDSRLNNRIVWKTLLDRMPCAMYNQSRWKMGRIFRKCRIISRKRECGGLWRFMSPETCLVVTPWQLPGMKVVSAQLEHIENVLEKLHTRWWKWNWAVFNVLNLVSGPVPNQAPVHLGIYTLSRYAYIYLKQHTRLGLAHRLDMNVSLKG